MPCRCVRLGALALLLASAWPAQAQPATADSAWSAVTLPGARQLDLQARANGQRYRIFVAAPPGPAPEAGHAVLYVLDANAAFPVAAQLARNVASRQAVTGQPAPLVVGIGYPGDVDYDVPARQRDYTPAPPAPEPRPSDAGGAAPFLDFIEQELKPLIAARHPVNPRRQALFGHSYGGLFVLHTLLTRPQAFSSYLASSPSLWWNQQQVLHSRLTALAALPPEQRPRVQISVGALEDELPPGGLPSEMRAQFLSRPMLEPARAMAARLRQLSGYAERLRVYELAGENHGSAWLPALTRGLQFFLESPEASTPPRQP